MQNLKVFEHYYEEKWFPYTMPASDIYGLRQALENIKNDPEHLKRHNKSSRKDQNHFKRNGTDLISTLRLF